MPSTFTRVLPRRIREKSVRSSYLAAVKGAGIILAAHPRIAKTRPLTRDVWTLLGRLSSEWEEDIVYFRRLGTLRRDIEMGLSVAVSVEMANEYFIGWGVFSIVSMPLTRILKRPSGWRQLCHFRGENPN
ncbi:MAG: SAV_6107 family HEPN domain-containing protein [Lawsonella clevelandensis]